MAEAGKRSIFQDGVTLHATEAPAGAAGLLPGALVELAGGEFVAATADGTATQPLVLDYNMLQAGTVDDAWGEDEHAIARQLTCGALANVRVITGQTITKGAGLASNGNGQFRIAAAATAEDAADVILCYAEETITTAANNTLVRVRGA